MSFDIGSPHQGLRGKRKGRVNTALTNKTHGSYKQNTRFSQTKHTVLTNKTHGSYKQNTRLLQTKHTRLLQTKHTVLTKHTRSYKQNATPRSLPTLGHRSARAHVATGQKTNQQTPNPNNNDNRQASGPCAPVNNSKLSPAMQEHPLHDAQLIGKPLASDRRPPASQGPGCSTHSYAGTATCVCACVEGNGEGKEGILPRSLRSKYSYVRAHDTRITAPVALSVIRGVSYVYDRPKGR